jgi:hypothetical protein
MKHIVKIIATLSIISVLSPSCLKTGLPKPNNSSLNAITSFNYEYRWLDTAYVAPGTEQADTVITVKMMKLNNSVTISNDTIYTSPGIPGGLPDLQKPNVTLTHIWGYANIPDAATIRPLNGGPVLGDVGDYTKPVTYQVTAADGATAKWVIITGPLQ